MSETTQITAPAEQQVATQDVQQQQQQQQQESTAPKYTITHSDMPQMARTDAAASDDAGKTGDEPKQQESAPAATTTADDAGAEPTQLKQGRLQKRIDRLTKEKNDALRRVSELEQHSSGKPAEGGDTGEPDVTDFDSYDDYLKARDDWRDKQKAGKPDTQPQEGIESTAEFKDALDDVLESFDEVRSKYTDFDAVCMKQPSDGGPVITSSMVIVLADTDAPGEIAYYLGKHVEESVEISKMAHKAQIRAIAKIEAKLVSGAAPKPDVQKKTSSAPPPINPLSGAGADAPKKLSDARSHAEYREIRKHMGDPRTAGAGWI